MNENNDQQKIRVRDEYIEELEEIIRNLREQVDALNEQLKAETEEKKEQAQRLEELEAKVKQLEELLHCKAEAKSAKKPKFTENYSFEKNDPQKKQKKRKRHKSTGRRPKDEKANQATRVEDIYQEGVDPEACTLHRTQFAWRFIDGKAVFVCYRIWALPDAKELPLPPGVRNSKSEYGVEIILTLAFLHYWLRISLDNAREIIHFFTGLDISKSQAESLLKQLADDWSEEYEIIAELLALQLLVYIDETGWKVGKRSCYNWVFSNAFYVLFRCGVGRGKAEAETILGKFFAGIGVSDDYSAYKKLFSKHQLCWAHLLRKAIKLALQHPENEEYAAFLDGLCAIYHPAVRYQKDRRLSVGRASKVAELQAQILSLCTRSEELITKTTSSAEETFLHLQKELVGKIDCLFVFVEHPEVEPTNNRSERNLRKDAEVRNAGRTSKSAKGAKRRGIIMTVLASLATRCVKLTLEYLLAEISRWLADGRSIFRKELDKIHEEAATASS